MKGQGLLLGVVTAVVLAVVVSGFFLAGTPRQARRAALDQKRIEDISDFSDELYQAWKKHHEPPPSSLDEYMEAHPLADGLLDPVTKQPYGYRSLGDGKYEMCATFDAAVGDEGEFGAPWAHPAGSFCFQFDARRSAQPLR
jgi:hypothetical protein